MKDKEFIIYFFKVLNSCRTLDQFDTCKDWSLNMNKSVYFKFPLYQQVVRQKLRFIEELKKERKMKEKLQDHLNKVYKYINIEDSNFNKKDFYIAGGCIRSMILNEEVKDVDIFITKEVDVEKFLSHVKEEHCFERSFFISDNAVNFTIHGIKYQIVTTVQNSPKKLIDEFDFTINMNYYENNSEPYIENKQHILDKQLKFNLKCRNRLGTLSRVTKFVERGYKVPTKVDFLELGTLLTRELGIYYFKDMQEIF